MFDHDWEPAEGTIIDIRYKGAGNDAKTVNAVYYLVEVRPQSGEPPFRTVVEPPTLMLSFEFPHEGQVVRMECIPAHKKARFDRHDPSLSKKGEKEAAKERWEAELRGER